MYKGAQLIQASDSAPADFEAAARAAEHQQYRWLPALDTPDSASKAHIRWRLIVSLVIVIIAGFIVVFGDIHLPPFPQFTTFHASFIFIGDTIIGFLLLGQFHYSRLPSYLILSGAYLFNALTTITFLFTFPGALMAEGCVIGGAQSAIWVWHFWHILFPAIIILALLVHVRFKAYRIEHGGIAITAMLAGVLLLAAAVAIAVTLYHDALPVLLGNQEPPLTEAFYLAGATAATVTLIALLFTLRLGQQHAVLYIWLTVVLAAFLADIIASLGAHDRYTLGWYGGRIESMIAATILLPVFLSEINLLYRQVGSVMEQLASANSSLQALVREKDDVMATLKQREVEMSHMAYHDQLTALPNRRLLMDRLQQALAQATHFRRPLAVMFMDLDHFKEINDSLGHHVGDELLRKVAERLKGYIRGGDTVSRIGGDEFIIVMSELHRPLDATLVAEKALVALAEPFHCLGHELKISTSIGIAVCPADHSHEPTSLINNADAAMYQAKTKGRNRYQFFQAEEDE